MYIRVFKFFLILFLFYQSPLHSKTTSFKKFDSKDLSNYFSGIVAFENKKNLEALKFFNLSKILINQHDDYLKKYVTSLVLEKKVSQAINVINSNKNKKNTNFFDAYLLIIIENLKNNKIDDAYDNLNIAFDLVEPHTFDLAILETLKQYIFVFKERKLLKKKKEFGNLTFIAETFQRCFLNDPKTENFFLSLINKNDADYTRYIYFYLSYLVENNNIGNLYEIISEIDYINSTLLLSQGKHWVENKNYRKFQNIFSCKNHNHLISEFLFLISNLYTSQENYERSNFYLYLSNFLNPKFVYNLSLAAENYYLIEDFKKLEKTLINFKKDDIFYYWYRKKKEAQVIGKQKSKKDLIDYISIEFNKINEPNNKMIIDIANFYKNSKNYDTAIKYYSELIENSKISSDVKSDLLYRRGGSYERKGDYINSDKDLLASLSINPNDAYVLNYLAYSWLERDYKIDEAIEMLEIAYASKSNDPYIIDSIGWAYYLIKDYLKAEQFLKRAVELMPEDPIVNDHYGDILWQLNRKIQARYFWKNVLKMDDVEKDMVENINLKLLKGIEDS